MSSVMKEYTISQELKVLYNKQNVGMERGKRYCCGDTKGPNYEGP